MSDKNLAMETIDWWRLSSPCLCILSLRHTEISSLITDYYIINEMLYGLACVALTDVTLVALFIATSRGGIRIGSVMHSFLIICHSRHMWFFEKNISRSNVRAVSVQPISFLFRKNKQFSSISRKCKMPFSILFDCCNREIQFWIPFYCIEIFFGFPRLYSRNWTD